MSKQPDKALEWILTLGLPGLAMYIVNGTTHGNITAVLVSGFLMLIVVYELVSSLGVKGAYGVLAFLIVAALIFV